MRTEHQWAAGPFGPYCGRCGWTWEPADPSPEVRDFLRLVNGEAGNNDYCGDSAVSELPLDE